MYVGSLPAVSNREDWQQALTLVDAETGDIIDISACRVTMTVRDFKNKCVFLTGSTTTGEITLPEAGTLMWSFPAARMNGLCEAQYEIGLRIAQSTRVAQLVVATIEVLEGIDQQ